jgi:alpha-L-arabinofuranosidase
LLSNEDYVQWRPDMIWFNNRASWGSASYEVQRLFMNNVGNHVVPSTATGTPSQEDQPISGAVGLSTWGTAAAYDDVRVSAADGTQLFADDFSATDANWTNIAGRGSWAVTDGAYVQSDTAAENTMVMAGDPSWQNYDVTVKATKLSGREGFLVGFGVKDTNNYYWWNIGGWNNTQTAVEKATGGGKSVLIADGTAVETGRQYDIRVEVRGRTVSLFLDGQKWGEFTDSQKVEPFRQVVTRDSRTGELVVKVVNAAANAARTNVQLQGANVERSAKVTTLAGDADDVNTQYTTPIAPRESRVDVGSTFTYTFAPYSVTFIRIKTRSSS